ncbi:MAG: TetR/AcrR family transcriptional regulator [Bacilli bacterium]|nr:TetR/AcrR family transcriptional regulator [Bacilli bacterium]
MKKQPQITEKTKNNLMTSFWNLYKNKDISKIKISNICDKAKYERTTFYRYFNDISDILTQLEDEVINNLKKDINNKGTPNNHQGILCDGFKDFTNKYGEYIVYFYLKGNVNFYNKFKDLVKTDVYDYLKFSVNDEIKKDFIFEFLFSSLLNQYSYWYRHKNVMALESFVELSNTILSNGVKSILEYKK